MSRRGSATPFAKALFEVALGASRAEEVGRELAAVAAAVTDHRELAKLLTNPAVPTKAKHAVIDGIAAQTGASDPLKKLLGLLADRDQLSRLPAVNDAYQARLMQHQGVVEAHVTTAVPLPADKAAAIAAALRQATGKDVRLVTDVDHSIMGGVVARLGSKVYDGSVSRQLERIRERLGTEGA